MSIAPPLKLAFQAIDLCQPGPAGIRIEHFTGRDLAKLDASVSLVDFLGSEEIGLNFPKTGMSRTLCKWEGHQIGIRSSKRMTNWLRIRAQL